VADAELGADAVVGAGAVEARSGDEPQAPTGTTAAMIAATAARRNNGDLVSGIVKLLQARSCRPSLPQLTLASVRVGNQLSNAVSQSGCPLAQVRNPLDGPTGNTGRTGDKSANGT
jgi:hypothetical protein